MQYALVIFTFLLATIGWFKSDKTSTLKSVIAVILLILVGIGQWYIISVEAENADNLSDQNDSLLLQNKELFENNQELLDRVADYQSELEAVTENADLVRDYGYVAKLGLDGTMFKGKGIRSFTPISRALDGSIQDRDTSAYWDCDSVTLSKLRAAILERPKFPFAHYCLAKCLHRAGDKAWKNHTQQAVEILKRTTQIPYHKPFHDQALTELLDLLNE